MSHTIELRIFGETWKYMVVEDPLPNRIRVPVFDYKVIRDHSEDTMEVPVQFALFERRYDMNYELINMELKPL